MQNGRALFSLVELLFKNRARDHVELGLGGATADLKHAHIAQHPFQRQILRIAGGTKHLEAFADDFKGCVAGVVLGHRSFVHIGQLDVVGQFARIAGGTVDQQTGGIELDLGLGNHPLQIPGIR